MDDLTRSILVRVVVLCAMEAAIYGAYKVVASEYVTSRFPRVLGSEFAKDSVKYFSWMLMGWLAVGFVIGSALKLGRTPKPAQVCLASSFEVVAHHGPQNGRQSPADHAYPRGFVSGLDLHGHQPGLPLLLGKPVLAAPQWVLGLPGRELDVAEGGHLRGVHGIKGHMKLRGGLFLAAPLIG